MTGKFKTLALIVGCGCGLWLLQPQTAAAGPISVVNFYGSVYTLYGAQTGANSYSITLLVDAQNFNDGGSNPVTAYFDGVSMKFDSTTSAASLTSAPGGTGNWSTSMQGMNSNGCGGGGGGFFCSDSSEAVTANKTGQSTSMNFTWNITDTGDPIGGVGTLKVLYTKDGSSFIGGPTVNGYQAIYSGPIAMNQGTVPEPASLLLLGSGLLGLALAVKKYALV